MPSLQSAEENLETNSEEEVEIFKATEPNEEVAEELQRSPLLAVCSSYQQTELQSAGEEKDKTRDLVTDLVTALPTREANMDSHYATYTKCNVLSDHQHRIVNRQNSENLEENTRIMDIMEQEKVVKKLRELEMEDLRHQDQFNDTFRRGSNTRSVASKSLDECNENLSVGTRRIILSNTEVNKNRPKLLGPSRFGY